MYTHASLVIILYGLTTLTPVKAYIQELSCYQERSLYKTLEVMHTHHAQEKTPHDLLIHVLKKSHELLKSISLESICLLQNKKISIEEIKKIHTIVTCCDGSSGNSIISTLRNARCLFEGIITFHTPTTTLESKIQKLSHLMIDTILLEKNIRLFINAFQEAHRPRRFIGKTIVSFLFISGLAYGAAMLAHSTFSQHNHVTPDSPSDSPPSLEPKPIERPHNIVVSKNSLLIQPTPLGNQPLTPQEALPAHVIVPPFPSLVEESIMTPEPVIKKLEFLIDTDEPNTLNLAYKDLTDLTDLETLPDKDTFTIIKLSCNKLTSLPDTFFHTFSNVEKLYLKGNLISQALPVFSTAHKLKWLDIRNNKLTSLEKKALKMMLHQKTYIIF